MLTDKNIFLTVSTLFDATTNNIKDQQFWQLVIIVDWKRHFSWHSYFCAALLWSLSPNQLLSLRSIAQDHFTKARNALRPLFQETGNDMPSSNIDALAWNIVSLGPDVYHAFLASPLDVLQAQSSSLTFYSFGSIFPGDDQFIFLTDQYYKSGSEHLLADVTDLKIHEQLPPYLHDNYQTVINALTAIKRGDFESALRVIEPQLEPLDGPESKDELKQNFLTFFYHLHAFKLAPRQLG